MGVVYHVDNHMCIWCSWKPEARVRPPGTRVPEPCDLPCWCCKCGFDFSLEEVSALNYGSTSLAPYIGILNYHLHNRWIQFFSNFLHEAWHPSVEEALSWQVRHANGTWNTRSLCSCWSEVGSATSDKCQGLKLSQWWPYLVPDTKTVVKATAWILVIWERPVTLQRVVIRMFKHPGCGAVSEGDTL